MINSAENVRANNQNRTRPVDNSSTAGIYGPLLDRGISEATAKRYSVKIAVDSKGYPTQHFYPYFTANEVTAVKVR